MHLRVSLRGRLGLRLEKQPRLVVGEGGCVVVLGLELDGGCVLVDVELGDEVDHHALDRAATVGVPLEERALAPAEVLEADEDGRTLELGAGVVERVDASKSAPLWAESVFIVGVLII